MFNSQSMFQGAHGGGAQGAHFGEARPMSGFDMPTDGYRFNDTGEPGLHDQVGIRTIGSYTNGGIKGTNAQYLMANVFSQVRPFITGFVQLLPIPLGVTSLNFRTVLQKAQTLQPTPTFTLPNATTDSIEHVTMYISRHATSFVVQNETMRTPDGPIILRMRLEGVANAVKNFLISNAVASGLHAPKSALQINLDNAQGSRGMPAFQAAMNTQAASIFACLNRSINPWPILDCAAQRISASNGVVYKFAVVSMEAQLFLEFPSEPYVAYVKDFNNQIVKKEFDTYLTYDGAKRAIVVGPTIDVNDLPTQVLARPTRVPNASLLHLSGGASAIEIFNLDVDKFQKIPAARFIKAAFSNVALQPLLRRQPVDGGAAQEDFATWGEVADNAQVLLTDSSNKYGDDALDIEGRMNDRVVAFLEGRISAANARFISEGGDEAFRREFGRLIAPFFRVDGRDEAVGQVTDAFIAAGGTERANGFWRSLPLDELTVTAAVAAGLGFVLDMAILRPYAQLLMHSMLYGGEGAVVTALTEIDITPVPDNSTGLSKYVYSLWAGSAVMDPNKILVFPDVLSAGNMGGDNTNVFDMKDLDVSSGELAMFVQKGIQEGRSIIPMFCLPRTSEGDFPSSCFVNAMTNDGSEVRQGYGQNFFYGIADAFQTNFEPAANVSRSTINTLPWIQQGDVAMSEYRCDTYRNIVTRPNKTVVPGEFNKGNWYFGPRVDSQVKAMVNGEPSFPRGRSQKPGLGRNKTPTG